jgi:hypothetical protein
MSGSNPVLLSFVVCFISEQLIAAILQLLYPAMMIALTAFSLLLAAVPSHATVIGLQKRSSLTNYLTSASVSQSAPGSADFKQAIKPFNLWIPFTPIAVAVPTTVALVQAGTQISRLSYTGTVPRTCPCQTRVSSSHLRLTGLLGSQRYQQ